VSTLLLFFAKVVKVRAGGYYTVQYTRLPVHSLSERPRRQFSVIGLALFINLAFASSPIPHQFHHFNLYVHVHSS
jgi:hypothetical protein